MSIENLSGDGEAGVLYLVATPIGNLDDISRRGIDVLKSVDHIAAEDTRHSGKLLSHLGIQTRLLACHEHNEDRLAPKLIEQLQQGQSIALISDAGTPLVSDPGYRLVEQAHSHDLKVVPVPGACAAIAALSAAGLATDRFSFEGFPPAKSGARLRFFEALSVESRTMVFYVSCHKIIETLSDMVQVLGSERRVTFARELTKTFETIKRSTLLELLAFVEADEYQRKGEIVLVLEGVQVQEDGTEQILSYLKILLDELPVKQAVKLVVKMTGANKNEVYKLALSLKDS